MEYSKSFIVISTIFTASSPGVDSISRIFFLGSSMRSNSSSTSVYYEIAASQCCLRAPLLIPVLLLFPPHLQLLPPWSLSPLSIIHEGWNQLPLNSCSCYFDLFSWTVNVLSGIKNDEFFPEGFQCTSPRSSRGIIMHGSYGHTRLQNVFPKEKDLKVSITPWSMSCEWMLCQLAWRQLESCPSPSELLGDQVHCQWAEIFWKKYFTK